VTYRTLYVYYDPLKCDWNKCLEKARRSRPARQCGTIICLPAGGRLRPLSKNETPRPERRKSDDRQEI
jgi:hypothetical protein